ncbi:Tn3 family transposase [Limobrevibacterium gyesilva]|uniref:Tn3 family transposase n=1 Tax=Limobrevibacterium gyesilva TaxID=2991712 RepID=A0AA42CIV5_9PROT|nr:Tn3 family transposase [Limobrevibacterium gyesilva]MCW3476285.1 Tn3 family transposase [Limobrevibacterium gyesilva]
MAHRQLLTDEERQALLGIPLDADNLARCFTLSRADRELVAKRRRDANRIGFAVQLALLRHPGIALAQLEQPAEPLVQWLARQLEILAAPFAEYARRPQTLTDHARLLAKTLGLRPPGNTDLPMMIEVAAQAAWSTDRGQPIAAAVASALRAANIILPAGSVIERAAIAGRARARRRATDALLAEVSDEQTAKLDQLLVRDAAADMTPFAWLKAMPVAPKADHVRELLDRLRRVRDIGLPAEIAAQIDEQRLRQFVREGHASDAHQLGRYAARRRRAILVATVLDLEARLTDAVLDMADKLIGGLFAKARNATRRRYAASAGDVGRLMRLFHGTIDALATAQADEHDAFETVDETVGWAKLLRVRGEVADLANLAEEDPLLRAADRWKTLHKFAPDLIEALEFRAARAGDPMLAALQLLIDMHRSAKREVPPDAPMPFRKDWRRLVLKGGQPNRRLYETAVLATLRDKLRSGDIWVERSSSYRRFDSYLLPSPAVPAVAAELGLPVTADEWLSTKGTELDRRLKRFARRLQRGELEGIEYRDGRLQVSPVKATVTPEGRAFADGIEAMMPRVRITELLHEVNRATGFASAFTNLRTGERCDDGNALLAAILADATNLGLGRMAAASHGVTRDKLIWTAGAYIRPETYKAALARIIDAHHALPIATIWGDGSTSSSDRQFFRSAKRGDAAGEVNARYGQDPGLGFYTHVSDQHGPYSARVMSATSHEAPYVLDGLMHHGTALRIGTHYTDTGGASDHVFILCAMLGFRFCPRLRDFPDRKFACIEPAATYKELQPLFGRRIRTDVIREHWDEVRRLVASLQAGTVLPSAMLKRLAAFQRQNQLGLALQELGRIERTLFMLDWLESPQLRQLCQAGLNKSEQRHALAQVICTFKQGRIADRGQDAHQFRASGLNLVIAAIVYWNSTYLADAVDHLRSESQAVSAGLLAHTSPLSWEHIGFSGDFLWDRAAATAGQRRPLNLSRERRAA